MKTFEDLTNEEKQTDFRFLVAKCFQQLYPKAVRITDGEGEDRKEFITIDGTPKTCHLFLTDNCIGCHVVFTNDNTGVENWSDYLIEADKVFLNNWNTEVTLENVIDKLVDVAKIYNK
jgi:hypothetical protein